MENIRSNISTENILYINYLKSISRNISIYIYVFYLIIGNFGAIFKILFFLQKPVRTCPCSVYIIATTIADFITLNNIPILIIFSNLYPSKNWMHITTIRPILLNRRSEDSLQFTSETIQMCKIQNYLHMWSTDVSIQLLLLASINRYVTSLKKLNQRSHKRFGDLFCHFLNAIKLSVGICIFWAFISLHHYFNFTLVSNFCIPKHFTLWSAWISNVHCLIPSTCMIIFSILTLMNIRKGPNSLRRHCRKASSIPKRLLNSRRNPSTRHHIELQLTSMIIVEIVATILTTLPYAIFVTYQAMRIENVRSSELVAREDLIEQLIRSTTYLEPSCGFYVYLFTLTTLRKRFLRILWNKMWFC